MNAPNPETGANVADTQAEEDKPLDPATEKVRRKLVKFSAVFMGLNMVALMAVLGAIVYKIGGYGDSDASAPIARKFESSIEIGSSTEVLSATKNGSEVAVTVRQENGAVEIWFYDILDAEGENSLSPVGKLTVK